jgi:uncharacterized protein (DUF2336 family)
LISKGKALINKSVLTGSDVGNLLKDPSPENRAATARKVSEAFSSGKVGDKERAIIEDIFKVLVRDTEELVRRSLSESLKADPNVPHDVALMLANDVASVALPMIEFSDVLSDQDLVEIIQAKPAEHQVAVARRGKVSAHVADVLADTHNQDVVATLVANEGADIQEKTFFKVLDEFGLDENISGSMVRRGQLPLKVTEKLVSLVSNNLREHLMSHHSMSADTLTDLVMQARETTIVGMLQGGVGTKDVVDLVDELYRQKRLTPTIVMRALCMGDVTFFEASLSRMGDVPVQNAYKLIHDEGELGLKALFDKCGLSKKMLAVARMAIKIADSLQLNSNDDRKHFQKVVIERLLTQFPDDFDTENLDYFITKLGSEVKGHKAA